METRGRPNKDKKGKKRGKGRRMEECFSFLCVTTLTWTGNHVALLSLSLFPLYVCLLPLDFLSLFVSPHSFLGPHDTRSSVSLSLWKAPPARTQLSGLCGWQSLRRHRRQMQRRSPALQLQRAGARFSSMHSRGAHALPRSGARRVYTWKHATRPSQGRTD